MFPELEVVRCYMQTLRTRLQILREDDRGMTTETVIITAALVAAAMAALTIIVNRISTEAETIGP